MTSLMSIEMGIGTFTVVTAIICIVVFRIANKRFHEEHMHTIARSIKVLLGTFLVYVLLNVMLLPSPESVRLVLAKYLVLTLVALGFFFVSTRFKEFAEAHGFEVKK